MEESACKGRLAVERNLQKAFKCVQSFYLTLQTEEAETLPIVTSVANLLEQLECCKCFDYSSLPFANSFPDAKARLVSKLESEIVDRLQGLELMLGSLKDKQKAVNKYCDSSTSLVEKYSVSPDLGMHTGVSPTTPPLWDMIEWLQHINTLLEAQYFCKLHVLEMVLADEGVNSQNLVQMWRDQDDALLNTIKDYLTRVEHFLGEKR